MIYSVAQFRKHSRKPLEATVTSFCLIALLAAACAQLMGQQTTQPVTTHVIKPDETPILMAGESISFQIQLSEEIKIPSNTARPVMTGFSALFGDPQHVTQRDFIEGKHQFSATGYLDGDGKTIRFEGETKKDQEPGLYHLIRLTGSIDRNSYSIEHQDLSLEIIPNPNIVEYVPPSSIAGTLSLNLTRAQLLRSKARLISDRLQQLNLELRNVRRPNLILTRSILLRAVSKESQELDATEEQELVLERDPAERGAAKAAFDDLRARYDLLLHKLQAVTVAERHSEPHLVLTQLSVETAALFVLTDESTRIIETTRSAFLLMASDGNYIHALSIQTQPQGATITYSTLTESHTWPKPSDIEIDTLHYGIWKIVATKDDWSGEATYDPYNDTHKTVQIILRKKQTR